jgi:hypothetical protein
VDPVQSPHRCTKTNSTRETLVGDDETREGRAREEERTSFLLPMGDAMRRDEVRERLAIGSPVRYSLFVVCKCQTHASPLCGFIQLIGATEREDKAFD